MARNSNSRKNVEDPTTAPELDRWYNLSLGPSFKDHSSTKFCSLRYEFKPASIDKSQPGLLHKNKENRVSVEFHNNQHGKPKVSFEGNSEDCKENDAVLFFDGESFQLERMHRAVKRLRHVRLPGESAAAAAPPLPSAAAAPPPPESSSSPIVKGTKFQPSNKTTLHPLPVEVERIDVGDSEILGAKPTDEKADDYLPTHQNPAAASPVPDDRNFDLEEPLDMLNDDNDVFGAVDKGNITENEFQTGIDINLPHQNETDDEIADVDVSDDEPNKGRNAAEALRAQVNAEGKGEHTSSSSGSSGSESSGSGSGSGSSSSDSESSESDSVTSI